MLLQLQSLFAGEVKRLPIDTECDLSQLELSGSFPFRRPVKVQGEVVSSAGIVTLRADITTWFEGTCDRCAAPLSREDKLHVEHTLVTSVNNEENDDLVLIENFRLPLDDLVEMDVLLALPSKNLCRPDCRGLCLYCGKNLNEGLCGCRKEAVEPRLEILRQLID